MLERFSATVDQGLLANFDRLLSRRGYSNRSEAVRDLIRQALVSEEWGDERGEVMATISLVYDHHQRNLLNRIAEIQHEARAAVISASHVHIDHHNCLEVIIARGRPANLRALADRLIALRGVKSGSLTAATTGKRLR